MQPFHILWIFKFFFLLFQKEYSKIANTDRSWCDRWDKHAHKPSTQTSAGPCWATQTEKWEKATNKKSHQQWYQPWGPTHTLLSENSEQYQSFSKTSCTALAIRRQETKRIKSRGERLQRIAGDVCEGPICNSLSTLFYKLYKVHCRLQQQLHHSTAKSLEL